jgi:hypothetical protein
MRTFEFASSNATTLILGARLPTVDQHEWLYAKTTFHASALPLCKLMLIPYHQDSLLSAIKR